MSLGLKRGTVELVPHDPEWARLFANEKKLLTETFGDIIVAIEHVGSTAIPDISAKPIIDMDVGIKSLESSAEMKEKFEQLGYEYRGNQGEEQRELFVKGPETKRTHHAHVTEYGSTFWRNDLLFRDYLRSYKETAREYSELKEKLAAENKDDRYAYTERKRSFIEKILKLKI